jgi:CRP-like cAMP-binding protein
MFESLRNAMGPRSQARLRPLLKQNSFLGRLPDTVFDALMLRGKLKRHAKGEVIYRRDDAGDSLMVLVAGQLKLTNISTKGKEVVLHFVVPGEAFGEVAALDGKERAANAVALEASEVLVIQTRDLLPALATHPDAMLEIIRALCEKVRFGAWLLEDRTLPMRARIARGLLRLAQQLGRRRKDGIYVQLAVSQEELGNYFGLARANVSRQLARLKSAHIIKIDAARIVIADERKLAELAEAASSREP